MSGKEELARLAYTIGKEVADNVGKKAAPVVSKAAKKVEYWTFKKKPNEMSGTEYLKNMNSINNGFVGGSALNRGARALQLQWKKQLKNDPILIGRPARTASIFARLEDANMPRKYTGKVAKGLLSNKTNIDNSMTVQNIGYKEKVISRGLKYMNESQRDTLIALLPEWDFGTSSVDDLISAAKNL